MPAEPLLPGLRFSVPHSISVTEGTEATTRCIAGQIKAFTSPELASALETTLRALTTLSALTEALLEVGTVRTLQPVVASPRALEGLALDLWGAGFCVRFGPSWTPAPCAEVCVGAGGDLQEFLVAHPSWSVV